MVAATISPAIGQLVSTQTSNPVVPATAQRHRSHVPCAG